MLCWCCGKEYDRPSMGGDHVCPQCDCGIHPDGTGWTPREVETKYAIEKAKNVTEVSKELALDMSNRLGITSEVVIDTKSGKIDEDFGIPAYEETVTPINFSISNENYT